MYVTVVQNISASTRSVSSLCDSLKQLNLHKIDPFFLRTFLLLATLLCMKSEHFSYAYISTKAIPAPVTYLIGARRRRRPIAVLSHTRIYLAHREKLIQYTPKSLSFILNKNKINLTINVGEEIARCREIFFDFRVL